MEDYGVGSFSIAVYYYSIYMSYSIIHVMTIMHSVHGFCARLAVPRVIFFKPPWRSLIKINNHTPLMMIILERRPSVFPP